MPFGNIIRTCRFRLYVLKIKNNKNRMIDLLTSIKKSTIIYIQKRHNQQLNRTQAAGKLLKWDQQTKLKTTLTRKARKTTHIKVAQFQLISLTTKPH